MKIKAIALSVALGVTMIAGVTSTTPAYATGIPVIDVTAIAGFYPVSADGLIKA